MARGVARCASGLVALVAAACTATAATAAAAAFVAAVDELERIDDNLQLGAVGAVGFVLPGVEFQAPLNKDRSALSSMRIRFARTDLRRWKDETPAIETPSISKSAITYYYHF